MNESRKDGMGEGEGEGDDKEKIYLKTEKQMRS
jgi:hypothetical protein